MTVGSDVTDKSWDHPWTTEEMRDNRADWNLAGDAGLLNHLQKFSDGLMSRANKTREALDSLTAQLDDTAIFIDNITNTSLSLANTQFIESRVHEDDVEIEKPQEQQSQESKSKEQIEAELIANIGDSVRLGLAIMDEKYERLEVVASDSEDEGEPAVPSVILRPKDPYQDRPLPFVIGSEKWEASSKVGLESSSSESEQQDEEESESDLDSKMPTSGPKASSLHNPRISTSSSSPSDSNDYEAEDIRTRHNNVQKPSGKNEDIFDSDSETTTAASSLPKNSSSAAPNFAEELTKRLGSVVPQKSVNTRQPTDEPSINKSKDDLLAQEDHEDLFSSKPNENLFSGGQGLFDEELPNSLWDDKPTKLFKSNVIPSSIDVPPPISNVSTKPKSAIDDLFGDADSEDSDNIFSSKSSADKVAKKTNPAAGDLPRENQPKRLLSVGAAVEHSKMKTSTPETNYTAKGLFDDEDDSELFGGYKKQNDWLSDKECPSGKSTGSSPAKTSDANTKKKPVGGVSILGQLDIFGSDFGSKFSDKLRRQSSTESSNSEATANSVSARGDRSYPGDGNGSSLSGNFADGSAAPIAGDAGNPHGNGERSGSSGISIQPPSIDNTAGSNMSRDFQPQMTSTRLKSEDLYRERVISDSLFTAQSRLPEVTNPPNTSSSREERFDEAPDSQGDVFFSNDDIFGPPPLPKAGAKLKSKVASLFDDSDSGDDLFSNTSSGSRSQKSADLLAITPQSSDKAKAPRKKGLFDDDGDIFGAKDSPDVDIFGAASGLSREKSSGAREAPGLFDDGKSANSSVFRDDEMQSSFEKENTVRIAQTKPIPKLRSIFDDEGDDDDLFGTNFGSAGKKAPSLFDAGKDDLFAAPVKSELTSGTSTESKETSGENSKFVELETAKGSINSSSIRTGEEVMEVQSERMGKKGPSLFGDGRDDLFAAPEKNVSQRKVSTSNATKPGEQARESKSEDGKFAALETAEGSINSSSISKERVKSAEMGKKGPSLFDGGKEDLFSTPEKDVRTIVSGQTLETSNATKHDEPSEEMKSKESKIGAAKESIDTSSVRQDQESQKLEKKGPSLFNDDEEDLFAVPAKSTSETLNSNKSDETSKEMPTESKTIATNTSDAGIRKQQEKIPENIKIPKNVENASKNLFDDDDESDLFSGEKATNPEEQPANELGVKSEVPPKPQVAKKPKIQHKCVDNANKGNQSDLIKKGENAAPNKTSEASKYASVETGINIPTTDAKKHLESEHSDDSCGSPKREPPKTLNIRSTSTLSKEESHAAARRVVSGKIKNLMGKMGDLRIRSPTDIPALMKKNEDKVDEEDLAVEKDSADGGSVSALRESPPSSMSYNSSYETSQQSSMADRVQPETAVSFDVPAQVETLAVTASKSRVRIQTKRRPQTRHARQSALRKSGIDFDIVDSANDNNSDTNRNLSSNTSNNNPTTVTNSSNAQNVVNLNTDRLIIPTGAGDSVNRQTESSPSLFSDDRSDRSLSKESSMSINRNTLLSPSTDEEDLFDVPPDLPEDPQREDLLFGRAPILSPLEPVGKSQKGREDVSDKSGNSSKDNAAGNGSSDVLRSKDVVFVEDAKKERIVQESREDAPERKEEKQRVIDPLRDDTIDPLKDSSQLFAFVTKTPSPEQRKNLLLSGDDSLFSTGTKKLVEDESAISKKQTLDLFTDDTGGDLFSVPLNRPPKKLLKDSNISLFDDDDDGDDLFGASAKKAIPKNESSNSTVISEREASKQGVLFEGVDDSKARKNDNAKGNKTAKPKDIFGEQSSGEDDIFIEKKTPNKVTTISSLFSDDEDSADIFGKANTSSRAQSTVSEGRGVVKKLATKDLRKTAEKIVEDPLSMLQED